jgi:hypothetical protein
MNTSEQIVAVRAYAQEKNQAKAKRVRKGPADVGPSDYVLILTAQTTRDAAQRLTLGGFQVRRGSQLLFSGCVYDPGALTKKEVALIKRFAEQQELRPPYKQFVAFTRSQFVKRVFIPYVYGLDAFCVGFDLPFVLSRLAIGHTRAKVRRRSSMRGGFSFVLTNDPRDPRLQLKHITRRMAFIKFATPSKSRKRGKGSGHSPGYFIDLKTLASALLSRSWSLDSLAQHLNIARQKMTTSNRGCITKTRLGGGVRVVHILWKCFEQLRKRYQNYGLSETPITAIFSEASIGKAYLRQMRIKPWLEVNSDFPPELIGVIMSTFFGGRAEVHIRNQVSRVLYCDFLSMYPTISALMDSWRFVIAQSIEWQDATSEVIQLLSTIEVTHLQDPLLWKKLNVLVEIEPNGDLLPSRVKFDGSHYSLGMSHLTHYETLWYTLADCIASTLLTGRAPKVVRALRFSANGVQKGLKAIKIMGDPAYRFDPVKEDFYCRVIGLRAETKVRMGQESGSLRQQLNTEQFALKICANATSSGIFSEVNTDDYKTPQPVVCFGFDETAFIASLKTVEAPGRYFNPLLASQTTGGARLMLALAQKLTESEGLTWAFCDTDSIALSKPSEMPEDEFLRRAESVRQWFTPLNPYKIKESLLKIEDVNYEYEDGRKTNRILPLFCFAVSAKRHALFNLNDRGEPIIRKACSHGLGHLMPPYDECRRLNFIPPPCFPLEEIGDALQPWQYDLWYLIVVAALSPSPRTVKLNSIELLQRPVVSRYAASTPDILDWFKEYNKKKPYAEQVRPFNSMFALQAKPRHKRALAEDSSSNGVELSPVAPFDRNLRRALTICFNRRTGLPIRPRLLRTYFEQLAQFHLNPEAKVENANYLDTGFTGPRHINAVAVQYIGKETNRLEEQLYLGEDDEALISYGFAERSSKFVRKHIYDVCLKFGSARLAKMSRLSSAQLTRILDGEVRLTSKSLSKLRNGINALEQDAQDSENMVAKLREECNRSSIRQVARELGLDPANLSKILRGQRSITSDTRGKLMKFFRTHSDNAC